MREMFSDRGGGVTIQHLQGHFFRAWFGPQGYVAPEILVRRWWLTQTMEGILSEVLFTPVMPRPHT